MLKTFIELRTFCHFTVCIRYLQYFNVFENRRAATSFIKTMKALPTLVAGKLCDGAWNQEQFNERIINNRITGWFDSLNIFS
jgi:hypothetical protein